MRSLGRLGLALSIAGLATAANAAPDSRPPLPTDDWNAAQMQHGVPMQTDGVPPPPRGGWAREGWSDEADRGMRPEPPHADGLPGRGPGAWRDGDMRRDGPPGEWRRQTWDGGRGDAFAYRRGGRLPPIFVSPRYAVPDWGGYGLAPPGPGRRWVRYYDDAVLIDGRGFVVDAVPAIGWDDRGPDFVQGGGWRGHDRPWHPGPPPRIAPHGPGAGPQVYYGPGGATTIVITTAPSVTTTTTTVTESYVTSHKRVWQTQPARLVQTKPRRTVQTKPGR